MSIYVKVLKAIRIYIKAKIKFAFTTNHFVYPVHPGNLHRFFLPYSGQWCTPSNLMDLLGIVTVGLLDFFNLTSSTSFFLIKLAVKMLLFSIGNSCL